MVFVPDPDPTVTAQARRVHVTGSPAEKGKGAGRWRCSFPRPPKNAEIAHEKGNKNKTETIAFTLNSALLEGSNNCF